MSVQFGDKIQKIKTDILLLHLKQLNCIFEVITFLIFLPDFVKSNRMYVPIFCFIFQCVNTNCINQSLGIIKELNQLFLYVCS